MGKQKRRKKYNPEQKVKKITEQQRRDVYKMVQTLEASKMVSLYVLRNQGWGKDRLKRFSDKWNEYIADISNGWFSLSDIPQVLLEETGLTMDDLKLPDKSEDFK